MTDEEIRIDQGNFDLVIKEDENENVWVRPSLSWEDGGVYESFRDGQRMIYSSLKKAGKI